MQLQASKLETPCTRRAQIAFPFSPHRQERKPHTGGDERAVVEPRSAQEHDNKRPTSACGDAELRRFEDPVREYEVRWRD